MITGSTLHVTSPDPWEQTPRDFETVAICGPVECWRGCAHFKPVDYCTIFNRRILDGKRCQECIKSEVDE